MTINSTAFKFNKIRTHTKYYIATEWRKDDMSTIWKIVAGKVFHKKQVRLHKEWVSSGIYAEIGGTKENWWLLVGVTVLKVRTVLVKTKWILLGSYKHHKENI